MSEPIRVLLIDDEKTLCTQLTAYLGRNYGYQIDPAEDREHAFELLEVARGNYDVALIDRWLEDPMGGIEALKRIKASYPDIECIIMTAWDDKGRQEALHAGAFHFFKKSSERHELALMIQIAAQQGRLRRIGRSFLSMQDLDGVLGEIVQAVKTLTQADEAAIWPSPQMNERLAIHRLAIHRSHEPAMKWERLFTDRGFSSQIVADGRVASISDLSAYPGRSFELTASGYASMIGVPIPGEEGNLGVLYAFSGKTGCFDQGGTAALLQTLAGQAGLAITNASAYSQINANLKYMNALMVAGQRFAQASSITQLLDHAWEFVSQQLQVGTFYIGLMDRENKKLDFRLAYDEGEILDIEAREVGPDLSCPGASGYVLRTGQELIWQSQAEEQRVCAEKGIQTIPVGSGSEPQSVFYYPIIAGGEKRGLISIQSYKPHGFTPILLDAFRSLGSQLAISIENIRLLENMRLIHELGRQISAALSVEDVYNRTCQAVVSLFQADHSGLVIFDDDQEWGVVKGEYPPSPHTKSRRIPIGQAPVMQQLIQGEPLVFEDVDLQAEGLGPVLDIFHELEIRSIAIIPLMLGSKVIGSFSLDGIGRVRRFQPMLELCKTLAPQVTTAAENARLYEEARQRQNRLTALTVAARQIRAEQEPEKLRHEMVHLAAELLDCPAGMLFSNDHPFSEELELRAFNGPGRVVLGARLAYAGNLVGQAAKGGKTRLAYGPGCLGASEFLIEGVLYHAAIAAPLRHSGEVTAVLVTADIHPDRSFSELDQEIIERFADYAASAEHDSELISREQRNFDQIKLLHRLSEAMQSFNSIDDIEMILLTGLTADYGLRFNRAALLRLDPAQSRLVGAHGIGAADKDGWEAALSDYWQTGMEDFDKFLEKLKSKEIPPSWLDKFVQKISLPADSEAFNRFRDRLIQNHVLTIYPNQADPDLPAELLASFNHETALAIIPLMTQGNFVGLVAVDNAFTQAPITGQDCEALLAFGAAGALAIHNAQLLADAEANQKVQETILQAGRRLLSLKDLEQVAQDIVQQAQLASGAMGVTMALIDEPFEVSVVAVAGLDQPEPAEQLIRPDGVSRRVMMTGERAVFPDTSRCAEELNQAMVTRRVRAALCFPVFIGSQAIGVMWFHYPTVRYFREVELDQIQAFVNQAAQAYDNAWQLRQLELITQSAAGLTGASESSDILDWIIDRVRAALKADRALALIYDDQAQRFVHGSFLPADLPEKAWERFIGSVNREEGTATQVMRTGWLQISNGSAADQKSLDPATRRLLAAAGGQDLLGVAMRVGEERLGVIYAIFAARRDLRPRDLEVAQTLAYLAGIALKRARSEKRFRNAYSTARLTAQLSTLGDVMQTLNRLVDGALQALECDAVTLYTYDQEHDTFGRLPSMAGVRYPEKVLPREVFGPGSRVRRILESGVIYIREDTPRDTRLRGNFSRREGVKATVAAPLKVGETKVGLMFVNYRKPHHFTQEEIDDINLFADLAAMATYKGQLVESGEINRRGLLQIHEVSAALNQATETEDLLPLITDRLSQVFGGLPASLMQWDEAKKFLIIKAKIGVSDKYQANQKIPADGVRAWLESAAPGPFVFDLCKAPFGDPELLQQEGLCTALTAPLWAGGNFVGAINVYTTDQERKFDQTEREWIRILGNHAAITIQNAAHYARVKEHTYYLGNLGVVRYLKNLSQVVEHRLIAETTSINYRFDLLSRNIDNNNLPGARKDLQELDVLIRELEGLPSKIPLIGVEGYQHATVHTCLRDFVQKLEQKTAKEGINIQLALHNALDAINIKFNQELLREVLNVLAENAIKAIRMANKDKKVIQFATRLGDGYIEITIKDNGSGIPTEHLTSLFREPIEQGSHKGVGLFFIRPIIENYDGKIDYIDTGPEGTTFYIRFPIKS